MLPLELPSKHLWHALPARKPGSGQPHMPSRPAQLLRYAHLGLPCRSLEPGTWTVYVH